MQILLLMFFLWIIATVSKSQLHRCPSYPVFRLSHYLICHQVLVHRYLIYMLYFILGRNINNYFLPLGYYYTNVTFRQFMIYIKGNFQLLAIKIHFWIVMGRWIEQYIFYAIQSMDGIQRYIQV